MSENLNVSDVVLKRFLLKNQIMQLITIEPFKSESKKYNNHGIKVSHKGNRTFRAIFVRKSYGRIQPVI